MIKHSIDEDGNDAFEKITDLSKDEIGNIDSSMYVYDYKSCESDDDLVEKAIEEFKNHLETKEINLGVTSLKAISLQALMISRDFLLKQKSLERF